MLKKIAYLLIVISMASCASFNAPENYTLDPKSKNGLAVFSFTSTGVLNNFFLQYQNTQNDHKGDITLWTNRNPLDWNSNNRGRLVTLDLPAGKYEIYRLVSPLVVSSNEKFSIPFEVSAGKVIYIGRRIQL